MIVPSAAREHALGGLTAVVFAATLIALVLLLVVREDGEGAVLLRDSTDGGAITAPVGALPGEREVRPDRGGFAPTGPGPSTDDGRGPGGRDGGAEVDVAPGATDATDPFAAGGSEATSGGGDQSGDGGTGVSGRTTVTAGDVGVTVEADGDPSATVSVGDTEGSVDPAQILP